MSLAHSVKDRQLFNRIAKKYCAKDLADSSRYARKHRLLQSLKVVPIKDAKSILEVGCGAGFSAAYLQGMFERFVGVDYADQLIEYAIAHHQGPGVEFHACDIREFTLDDPCDIVVMIGVLHHFDDIPEIMQHIVRMVKPGGWIVANEPQPGNPLVQMARLARKSLDRGYSEDQVTLNSTQLREIYHGVGLTDIRVVPQGYVSTPFAEVVLQPQFVTRVMSKGACTLDRFIPIGYGNRWLERFSWNLIAAGRKL